MASGRKRVVIVGGGFAGMAAIESLRGAEVDLILIDRHNHHTFTPLIYQVATAMLEPSEIAHPIRRVLRNLQHGDFRLGSVTEVDLDARQVYTRDGSVGYDYLLLAAGSSNNYFKHPEIAERSFGINDVGEAVALRNHLLSCFERASWESDEHRRRELLTFVVVGGGPTGVEFAGSLGELVSGILPGDFPWLDSGHVTIRLIEGSEAPLPPFHPRLQRAAARALAKRNVTVSQGHVESVSGDPEHGGNGRGPDPIVVRLADGSEFTAGTVLWAAGVRADEVTETLGVELGSQRRIPVGPTLQMPVRPEVLAAGDVAEIVQDGEPLPMLAPVAMQSGAHAGRVIAGLVAGQQPEPFRYRAYPIMATIGRGDAVIQGKRLRIGGVLGWILWLIVHLGRVAGLRARFSVAVDWTTAFLLRDRPMRLIVRPRRPDLDR